jgi:hypothetical protein
MHNRFLQEMLKALEEYYAQNNEKIPFKNIIELIEQEEEKDEEKDN